MASIPSLVRPAAAFDPETISVPAAALDEAWDRLLGWEASVPSPPMRMLCARWLRGASRYGVKGIGHEKELADGVVRFLAAN